MLVFADWNEPEVFLEQFFLSFGVVSGLDEFINAAGACTLGKCEIEEWVADVDPVAHCRGDQLICDIVQVRHDDVVIQKAVAS